MKVGMALLLLALAGLSCGGGRPPDVLVIVVDTLRADRLGVYGNQRGLTPFLDELAARGTVFVNARAVSSWTLPSVASLMTSRYSAQHHVIGFGSRLADDEITFAEAMQSRHYVAAGFSANFQVRQQRGFAQGFQYWRADSKPPGGLSAAELRGQALDWLDGVAQADSRHPVLLYFQFMEPHSPYDPPEPFRSRSLGGERPEVLEAALGRKVLAQGAAALRHEDFRGRELLYDGEVATVDAEIRTLFADLQRRGRLDHAVVIITADHGEEFFEHAGTEHGKALFEESVRVPLILIAPGYQGGVRVDDNVSLVDVAPTLLELLGLPPEPRFEGRSLVPLLQSASLASRLAAWLGRPRQTPPAADVVLELHPKTGDTMDNRLHVMGIVRDSGKLLVERNGARRAFDLAADPDEQQPDLPALAASAASLGAALDDANRTLARRAGGVSPREPLDDATKESLRALGYEF